MLPTNPNAEDIFAKAIELNNASDRDAFLEKACCKDASLRAFLEELVESHFAAGDFMSSSAAATLRSGAEDETADDANPSDRWSTETQAKVGSFVGGYELLEEIGSGGMAVVYRARQQQPKRDVALKLLRPGMQSQQIVSRLARERQLLALMDHAGIAKVFDAGMSEGNPFYVMEYFAGRPIAGLAESKELAIRAKVELIQQASRALEHAHQKGIIHRDIKPDNILVSADNSAKTGDDGRYRVKVIDFGIAKLMAESDESQPELTRLGGQIIGTPQYMSPEQVRDGEKQIDTRSDIYSLGAVLYKLLTGVSPVPNTGLIETIRLISSEEPTSPRLLNREVDADLCNICMMCLRKDPDSRYQSARELTQDLQRYLDGHPVIARPIGRVARLAKWAKRSPLAATTTVISAIATTAFLIALVEFNAQLTSKQRDLQKRISLTDTVLAEMHDALREVNVLFKEHTPMGSKLTLAEQRTRMEKGIGMYDTLHRTMSSDPDVKIPEDILAEIRKERAEIYLEYGKVLLAQGDTRQSADAFVVAIDELQNLGESQSGPPAEEANMLKGVALTSLAKVYRDLGQHSNAVDACKGALKTYQSLAGTNTLSLDYSNWYQAITWSRIANIHKDCGELASARTGYRQSIQFARLLPGVGDFRLTLASALQALAKIELDQNRALEYSVEAVSILDSVVLKSMPPLPRYELARIKATWNLAKIQLAAKLTAGVRNMCDAIELQADWAARFPDNEMYAETLSEMLMDAAKHVVAPDDKARIEELHRILDQGDPIPRSTAALLLDKAREQMAEGLHEFKLHRFHQAREYYRFALQNLNALPDGFQGKQSKEMTLGAQLRIGHASFFLADYAAAVEPMTSFLNGQEPQSATERCILAFCLFQSGANTESAAIIETLAGIPDDSHGFGLFLAMRIAQSYLAGEDSRIWEEKFEQQLKAENRDVTYNVFAAIGACSLIVSAPTTKVESVSKDHRAFWSEVSVRFLRKCEFEPATSVAERWLASPNFEPLHGTPAFEVFAARFRQEN